MDSCIATTASRAMLLLQPLIFHANMSGVLILLCDLCVSAVNSVILRHHPKNSISASLPHFSHRSHSLALFPYRSLSDCQSLKFYIANSQKIMYHIIHEKVSSINSYYHCVLPVAMYCHCCIQSGDIRQQGYSRDEGLYRWT